jgi:hypothetical protein
MMVTEKIPNVSEEEAIAAEKSIELMLQLARVTTQRDDAWRLLSQERAAQERATEAARGLRMTDELLRGQVATLEELRDGYAEQLAAARALVREAVPFVEGYNRELEDCHSANTPVLAWLARARALLGDGAA